MNIFDFYKYLMEQGYNLSPEEAINIYKNPLLRQTYLSDQSYFMPASLSVEVPSGGKKEGLSAWETALLTVSSAATPLLGKSIELMQGKMAPAVSLGAKPVMHVPSARELYGEPSGFKSLLTKYLLTRRA